ncbi:hypothetical protein B6I21_01055 [candidate division KSB1 bacterium 4572_119]|nr:MAG: hypothetical protein B6I21_01055 [candidate division KSB1 bacterium 4572_119]
MKNNYLKVLLIEDDRVDQLAFKRFVDQSGLKYDYEVVSSFREAKSILTEKKFDVVITDYFLGDGTAFDVFNHVADSTVIITTGTGDEEIAVRAMKTGAYDYLIKDPDRNYLTVLPVTVENALKQKKADDNKKRLRLLESAVHHAFDPVIIVKHSSAGIENTEIVYVNKIFTKVTGYQPAEVMGKSPEFLFAKEIDENEINCTKRYHRTKNIRKKTPS